MRHPGPRSPPCLSGALCWRGAGSAGARWAAEVDLRLRGTRANRSLEHTVAEESRSCGGFSFGVGIKSLWTLVKKAPPQPQILMQWLGPEVCVNRHFGKCTVGDPWTTHENFWLAVVWFLALSFPWLNYLIPEELSLSAPLIRFLQGLNSVFSGRHTTLHRCWPIILF